MYDEQKFLEKKIIQINGNYMVEMLKQKPRLDSDVIRKIVCERLMSNIGLDGTSG